MGWETKIIGGGENVDLDQVGEDRMVGKTRKRGERKKKGKRGEAKSGQGGRGWESEIREE